MSETTSCYLSVCVDLRIVCNLLSSNVYTQKKFNTTAFVHRRVQEYYRNALQLTIILQLVNSTLQIVNSTLML